MRSESLLVFLALAVACAPSTVVIPVDSGQRADRALTSDVPSGDSALEEDGAASADAAIGVDAGDPGDAAGGTDGASAVDVVTALDAAVAADVVAAPDVVRADDAPSPADASVGPVFNYAATGPNAVEVWNGAIPGTEGAARVYYPRVSGATRAPLVVFAHGFQLNVSNYDQLLRHITSWGYVIASVDYPGTILGTDHRGVASAIRAARAAFAMGRVTGFPAAASVDAARAVAMGHSLGGKGAIMAVLDDAAFVAAVALDPVDDNPGFGGRVDEAHPSIAPERMGGLRVPLALFGASQSRCTVLGQSCAPEASSWRAFSAAAPAGVPVPTYPLLEFGHNDFVDTACGLPCLACARGAAPLTTRELALRGLSVGFLERFTKDVRSAQAYVDGEVRSALIASGVLWNGSSPLPACR